MTLAAGARLGPYEIESVLGAGGFGEVYKALVFAMLDPEAEAGTINAILNWTSLLRR